jgi:hypothetical protein
VLQSLSTLHARGHVGSQTPGLAPSVKAGMIALLEDPASPALAPLLLEQPNAAAAISAQLRISPKRTVLAQ